MDYDSETRRWEKTMELHKALYSAVERGELTVPEAEMLERNEEEGLRWLEKENARDIDNPEEGE